MDEGKVDLRADGYDIELCGYWISIQDGTDLLERVNFMDMTAFGLTTWLRDRIGPINMRIITGRDDGSWINIDGSTCNLVSMYDETSIVDCCDIGDMSATELVLWIENRVDW